MASNGLLQRAKTGTCRVCQRRRCTNKHVKVVGEVRRGYATGHIWECINIADCNKVAKQRIKDGHLKGSLISQALKIFRNEF